MAKKTIAKFDISTTAPEGFEHEPDATGGFWCHKPLNTLPPGDFISPYSRHKTLPTPGVEKRKAWIIGGGVGGLAAAFYLIRDGHMPAENITILEEMSVEGGSMDGAGNPEDGYIIRGGREMNWNYDTLWDLFQDIPALELPEGYSVLDEYRMINDNDPNYSKARLINKSGEILDSEDLGLSKSQQWELIRLMLKRKEELDDTSIEEYFSEGFLQSNFWFLFRTMFAFKNCHSLLETKLYLHRFLDSIDGFGDMSVLLFPKYNQYDTFIKPLTNFLREKGVKFTFEARVDDLDMSFTGDNKTVTGIQAVVKGEEQYIEVGKNDLVFALTGSMTEQTAYAGMDDAPEINCERHDPGSESGWNLWKNLAKKSPVFGKPEKFYGDVDKSIWESATLTCKPSPLVDKLKTLSVNNPYSGRTVTGGIVTFTDSNWLLSVTCNRQPHFPDQPDDTLVLWVYGLLMDKQGNRINKTMPECTGKEILTELCHHLGIEEQLDEIIANTKIRIALMPYITAQFMPRAAGDRPRVVPDGCTNLGLVGQFVETRNDIIFTMEASIRTARIGVYKLLNIPKQVPDISPTQYDIRNIIKGARALNSNKPFIGERMLHRLLDKTYFAHILPPLPEPEEKKQTHFEEELRELLGKGGDLIHKFSSWVNSLRENFSSKDK
ncbi:oleate hydratase [Idiomarina loihiensis]|jgi:oleate hydratase|uniref:Monoamine oxidase family protein, membrane associated n=1 Tax=Idiomarina loihiensis (strain ATCC BAA-735 / DSM 15497 / L2-TR) TaxID=283942 RepID=Q5R0T6_IDILO|nr:oleate hydratase [Idiomarina loihiensis]AAV82435.1 Monoamine oxidase family protein, membrane associated [Idiomarina loihiensis L2TR]AGM36472.1 myosin-cross-reactive antigen [Idiomarina loihiensis GSL 199]